MRYHFLEFLLDTDRFELYRNETRLAAEPQVIELLTLLLEQRQRMVSKDEIYGCIWKGRIVSEAALSSRIKSLRQLLGDNGRSQAVIKTVFELATSKIRIEGVHRTDVLLAFTCLVSPKREHTHTHTHIIFFFKA